MLKAKNIFFLPILIRIDFFNLFKFILNLRYADTPFKCKYSFAKYIFNTAKLCL